MFLVVISMPASVLGAGITVDRVILKGLYSIGDEEMIDMLGMHKGTIIDEAKIRKGIRTAFMKGIFEDISVSVEAGEAASVEVNVRERDQIRKIYVTGSYQLPEKLIKKYMIFREEDTLRYDLIPYSISDLKSRIAKKGYPSAEVSIETKSTDKPYRMDVYLKVNTGPPQTIKEIKLNILSTVFTDAVSGDRRAFNFSDLMKVSPGDIYDQERIENDLKTIRETLKKQGYFKPVIGPYTFATGGLEIPVNPGRRLEVSMEGNHGLATKTLLSETTLAETEDFNDEVVGEAVDRMLSLYHAEGYPFVQIAPVTRIKGENIDLSFFIHEGERPRIGSIRFSGSKLPNEKLKGVMLHREGKYYNPDLLEKDRETLKEFYGALGYLEANIKKIEAIVADNKSSADLMVIIEEGEKTEIASVEIIGADTDLKDTLTTVAGLKPGDPYNEVDISDARFRLLEYYNKIGYANIDVTVQRDIQNYRASIVFAENEGTKKYLDKTVIFGNRRTKYNVILRELIHKEGQPHSLGVFADEKQKLYKLGLFTDVEIETIEGDGDRNDVLVKVSEGNAGSVEFGVGYADQDRFRGFLEMSYRNLWGMNRQGLLRGEVSSLEQRYLMQLNEPWFMGNPLPLRVFLQYDKKREINSSTKEILFRLTRYTLTAGVEKKLSSIMKSEFYYEFSLVKTADVKPDIVLSKEDTGTLAISSVKPAIVYDTRDNPFEPEKGVLAGASLKFASSLLLSETNFAKLEVYASKFQKIAKGLVLALSARSGIAYHFGDTRELPLVERFFLGGRSTVRGFDQDTLGPKGVDGNPTGGNVFLMGNLELRASIGKGFGLVPFVDIGNIWQNTKQVALSELRYTTGLGLRYNTPVGPLRVDYGVKLNRHEGDSRSALHFSVGHAF
jgi:outer membrane protein insertion porin family